MKKIKKIFGRKKNIVLAVCLAVILVVVIGIGTITAKARTAMADADLVISARVEQGSIKETVVGTGTLVNETANEVEVPVGLEVEEVLVEAGDTVEVGTAIAKVTELSVKQNMLDIRKAIDSLETEIDNLDDGDDDYSLTKDVKTAEKEKLEGTLTDMEKLLETRTLISTHAGVIETINLSDNTVIEKNVVSADTAESSLSSTEVDASSVLGLSSEGDNGEIQFSRLTQTEEEQAATVEPLSDAAAAPVELYGTLNLSVAKPAKGAVPQSNLGLDESSTHFSSTIRWSPTGKVFAADTAYTAVIQLTAATGYTFSPDAGKIDVVVDSHAGPKVELKDLNGDGNVETIKVTMTYPNTAAEEIPTDAAGTDLSGANSSAGASLGGSSASLAGTGTSANVSAPTGSVDAADTASYNAYKTAGATVIPQDQMALNINVDELDILSVSVGQSVEISLDAVEDEVFTGQIEKIAADATNSGGVSKYTVKVSLNKTDTMKAGMSASATVTVDERAETLLVPMDALQEIDGQTFVYTSTEGEDGTLSNPVNVKTGLSNSEYVEILSGIEEGTEIYYNETISQDSDPIESMMNGGGMSGGGMMGGGMSNQGQGGEEQ